MRLSDFIIGNLEAILKQWEDFARSLASGRAMSIDALRDDAERMLRFVARDIESAQTAEQAFDKATGHGVALPAGQTSAAHDHGVSRAVDRFSLVELVAEYRALRASVTRMWIEAVPPTHDSVAQLVRFNEAIDQILSEGVTTFTDRMDHDADLFTASVGHDLANPVDSVTTSIHLLAGSTHLSAEERAAVTRIIRATGRLAGMLDDLRDFTRTRLGGLVRLDRERCDVGSVVRDIVDELGAVYAGRRVAVECRGDVSARVDVRRVSRWCRTSWPTRCSTGPRQAMCPSAFEAMPTRSRSTCTTAGRRSPPNG